MKRIRGIMLMGRTAMGRKLTLPVKLTRRRVFAAFLAIVVISAATAWVALWYFSFNVRFARSKTALDTYAAQAMASYPVLPRMPPHLGAFETGGLERLPHGFLFFCDYGHPLDANGLAYSTEQLPEVRDHDHFTHIEGDWYEVWRN